MTAAALDNHCQPEYRFGMPDAEQSTSSCPWSLDKRSLALSRVLLASVVLLDLAIRVLSGVREHLTDIGSYPRILALELGNLGRLSFPSIYFISGDFLVLSVLLALHAAAATGMMIGYCSRWSTVLTWYMTTSLTIRNEPLTSGADQLLCSILFWSSFVPMGAAFSVDEALMQSRNSPSKKNIDAKTQSTSISNPGTFALLVQVTLLYVVTALFKEQSQMWQSGSALHHVFSMQYLTLPPAHWLRERLSAPLAYTAARAVVLLELFAPALLWIPGRRIRGSCCLVAIVLFALMHASIGIAMNLYFFVLVDFAQLAAFLPASAWRLADAVTSTMRRRQRSLTAAWPSAVRLGSAAQQPSSLDKLAHVAQELGCLHSVTFRPLHPRDFAAATESDVCAGCRVWLRVTAEFSHEGGITSAALAITAGGRAAWVAENWSGVLALLRASPVAWLLAAPLLLALPSPPPPPLLAGDGKHISGAYHGVVEDAGSAAEPAEAAADASSTAGAGAAYGPGAAARNHAETGGGGGDDDDDIKRALWADPVDEAWRQLALAARRGAGTAAAVLALVLVDKLLCWLSR